MQKIENGSFLIAHPTLLEDTFFKSIILITHHSDEETIGLIINKPSKKMLHEIINDLPDSNFPVYVGGPVAKNSIHFIHQIGEEIPNSIKIMNDLYFGGDFEKVKKLIWEKKLDKNQIRFFAGYSGWEANQLQNEIKEQSWFIKKKNKSMCMRYSDSELWSKIIRVMDEKYAIWSNLPKNPSLN